MLFDTHTHANFEKFANETDEVIKRALDQGVWLANVGTTLLTSKSAAEIALKYPSGVYATVGLHPSHTWQDVIDPDESLGNHQEEFNEPDYQTLINEKVVAIGEIGLDYFRIPAEKTDAIAIQKKAFVQQLHFAFKNKLPIVIHCRDAYEDTLDIIRNEYSGPGILHSFTGDWNTAKKFLDLGYYIALNGILAFDKTGRLAEVCLNLPSDRILAETDAPYLAPPPYRGKRNEPAYVKYIVEKMAEVRGVPYIEIAQQTFQNALKIYSVKL